MSFPMNPSELDTSDRGKLLGLAVTALVFSGFIFAGLINISPFGRGTCTLTGCPCEEVSINRTTMEANTTPLTGEIECNECTGSRYLFHAGVFWIAQEEESTQVIQCRSGEKTGENYRVDSYGEIQTGNIFSTYLSTG
ncbi:hypothetical protein ACK3SF_01730 [Candidatus Nanosalina sp. VS9-1]|uniref:hypothetical protein n=1 Tax=Candidatus Nanosalina sp. VS9-1 TaxID=3388566 RepID=UPI0039E13E38